MTGWWWPDHPDALGLMSGRPEGRPALMADPVLKRWNQGMNEGGAAASAVIIEIITLQGQGKLPKAMTDPEVQLDSWHRMTGDRRKSQQARPVHRADRLRVDLRLRRRQQPAPQHRLPRRQGACGDQVRPLTTFSFDSDLPSKLWEWMANYEKTTGGRVLAGGRTTATSRTG